MAYPITLASNSGDRMTREKTARRDYMRPVDGYETDPMDDGPAVTECGLRAAPGCFPPSAPVRCARLMTSLDKRIARVHWLASLSQAWYYVDLESGQLGQAPV